VAKYSFYKLKLSELLLVHNPELYVEGHLKNQKFACSMPIYALINEFHCQQSEKFSR
jgi:hypothetical protein